MKIVITGSLGHISKPLTAELVEKGHAVKVISSNPAKQQEIEEIGATAAIGTLEDVAFLTETFRGADAVYCMIPPGNYLDPAFDIQTHYIKVGENYVQAILQSGVTQVVHLSSIGGNMEKDSGLLIMHNKVEKLFESLPASVAVTTMRPTAFYYNLYAFLPLIKASGVIISNYGENDVCPWVAPSDIAAAVAEELTGTFNGRKIRYVASEEISCNEIAALLGDAIGKPGLKWIVVSDEEQEKGMKAAGINPAVAEGLVKMNASIHNGKLLEDYYKNRPVLSKTKISDFAAEFAAVYNKQ
ncbi:NmrA family NAD(P)-binding protein [Filimonas effusa]|uniref:NAD-dependent dehydratase n=1 Tax=Filimonas effusa TaxID=2508721 RepID=A0A4Q1DC94_9BACT|nr:NmrA family NAD(P)-binding protein [Filimonas effusa]RXK87077.1 NAD-dependent dehydratase [Filimonas effusa]